MGSELSFWRTIGVLDGPSYRTEAYAIIVLVDVFDPTEASSRICMRICWVPGTTSTS